MRYKTIILALTLLFFCTGIAAKDGITVRPIQTGIATGNIVAPQFPGGEESLYAFLKENIIYPPLLVKIEMEGDINILFTINKEGVVKNAEIAKGFDPLADNEVLRVVKAMPRWTPASKNGETIDIQQGLNVTFTLNDELKEWVKKNGVNTAATPPIKYPSGVEVDNITNDSINSNTSVSAVESDPSLNRYPEFPGGQEALDTYLQTNMKYPKRALQYGIEGRAIYNLLIEPDGEISKIWVFKSLFPDCDQEAFYLIKKMPKWTPGLKDGKPVAMQVMLPIPFVLPK
ncbi:TonB family protein [Dysgonomonas sp. PFB1-18]|uniref:energy transducer TonB n=1 Tax=unclassified Dysgonomonas TaxID=2630389 RepID=UPI00247712B7|nr:MULTISPECIES: energy transducer TonB [unclassified Dysgonomonas]MDH6307686.1 TonB family protein [Dysgonomonas sp. PF1-14]MDH6337604.1 TonB family protein [Dysgonomonas sp. PF1-16]MDH6378828.1 TonB family protein [Dysgonomonas sp. PFB1-18]MDH6396463.1 TonB family protein [Dysgonomonas sp. PF1-23]